MISGRLSQERPNVTLCRFQVMPQKQRAGEPALLHGLPAWRYLQPAMEFNAAEMPLSEKE